MSKNLNQKLMTKITQRLSKAEKIIEKQQKQIQQQKTEIWNLMKIKNLNSQKNDDDQNSILISLRNFFIQKQLSKLSEISLNKKEINYLQELLHIENEQINTKFKNNKSQKISLAQLARQIEQMNRQLQKEGQQKIVKQNNINYFNEIKTLKIFFYKNGLQLGQFPFQTYQSRQSLELILDISEGFYPRIMEINYPDGAFFQIVDSMDKIYNEENDKLSKNQFLKQFPSNYITENGDLVNIQKGIEQIFKNNEKVKKTNKEEFDEQIQNHFQETLNKQKIQLDPNETTNDCRLKIRTNKDKFYYIDLNSKSTLNFLVSRLQQLLNIKKFKLLINYPRKELNIKTQAQESMIDLNLSPSAFLLLIN